MIQILRLLRVFANFIRQTSHFKHSGLFLRRRPASSLPMPAMLAPGDEDERNYGEYGHVEDEVDRGKRLPPAAEKPVMGEAHDESDDEVIIVDVCHTPLAFCA
jgi:hypothetical protein